MAVVPSLVAPTIPIGSLSSQAQPSLDAGDGVLLRPWTSADGRHDAHLHARLRPGDYA
jgi:hypothetical protein